MFFYRFIKIVLVPSIFTLIMACNGQDQEHIVNSYLEGEWEGLCTYTESYGWTIHSLTFSDNSTYSGKLMIFSGEECALHEREMNHYNGTYSLGTKIQTLEGLEAFELDIDSDRGGKLLTIVKVESDKLYFGGGSGGFEERHATLNMDEVYQRIPE